MPAEKMFKALATEYFVIISMNIFVQFDDN
jgi:hypothetical protein